MSSVSATALQADTGATQLVPCPTGTYKMKTGMVSLTNEITINTSDATDGTYVVFPDANAGSFGSGAILEATVTSQTVIDIRVVQQGSGYAAGDTLSLLSDSIGGSTNVLIAVNAVGSGGKLGACSIAAPGYLA